MGLTGTRLLLTSLLTVAFGSGLWAQEATAEAESQAPPEQLTFLTWNVLADDVEVAKRIPALYKAIGDVDADVIALQEVSSWFVEMVHQEPWLKRYRTPTRNGRLQYPRGLTILSKYPIRSWTFQALPSRQHRGVLIAELDVNGRTITVATAHMDSPLALGKVRARQLDVIFGLLKEAEDVVFLGDFNFGDKEQPETEHLSDSYVDLWSTLKPEEPGYTWNIEENGMAKRGAFPGETSRRIDRILVRSKVYEPKSVRNVGNQPVEPGDNSLFPADHYGVVGTVKRNRE